MFHLRKLRAPSIFNSCSSLFPDCTKTSLFHIWNNPNFYSTKTTRRSKTGGRIPPTAINEVQAALLEFLHGTRSMDFSDADSISKNSPYFLQKLLGKVDIDGDIRRSVTRLLRYNPVNEFEPFFESMGLKPYEYGPFLQPGLMFLSDDYLLLQNYRTLFNYGVARNKIGKIFREATQVFRYDHGILASKLKAYQELGVSQSFIVKAIVCCPYLLIGDVNKDFIKALEILREAGFKISWIEEHLSANCSYNWSQLLVILNLFNEAGYSEEQLGDLISQCPDILFEGSGVLTLSVIVFLLKFGYSMNEIGSMFLQFSQKQVKTFVVNIRQCFMFLNEIQMEACEIGKIVRSYPLLLGSCALKKTKSLLLSLNAGKGELCQLVQENPHEMKKWVHKSKVIPFSASRKKLRSNMLKTQFLSDLGFVEKNTIEKALKVLRGRGEELQERFDCLLKAGFDKKDVCDMIRAYPGILNLSKEAIKMKIDFLVNNLGYPISTLLKFPAYFFFTRERVKLRLAMYNWLKEQEKVDPMLALGTILACSDKIFVKTYVNRHPRGPEVWEDLKRTLYSEGKKQLGQFNRENPQKIKGGGMGSEIGPLAGAKQRPEMLKTKFLRELGFEKNSSAMKKALKDLRGRGKELQESFDSLVEAGLNREDACELVRMYPSILSQSKDVIKMKIDLLVTDLGYPLSTLLSYPSYFRYKIEKVKLRSSMYNWLREQGTGCPVHSLSTVLGCSDKNFFEKYVACHPRGAAVWQDLKRQSVLSDKR